MKHLVRPVIAASVFAATSFLLPVEPSGQPLAVTALSPDLKREIGARAKALATADVEVQLHWLDARVRRQTLEGLRPWLSKDTQAELERQIGAARQQLASRQRLADEQLVRLVELTTSIEQRVLERLAREYRIGIYNVYRADRAEYERRRQAWSDVESAWRLAGSRGEDYPQLIVWLREAAQRMKQDRAADFPAAPDFRTPLEQRLVADNTDRMPKAAPLPTPEYEAAPSLKDRAAARDRERQGVAAAPPQQLTDPNPALSATPRLSLDRLPGRIDRPEPPRVANSAPRIAQRPVASPRFDPPAEQLPQVPDAAAPPRSLRPDPASTSPAPRTPPRRETLERPTPAPTDRPALTADAAALPPPSQSPAALQPSGVANGGYRATPRRDELRVAERPSPELIPAPALDLSAGRGSLKAPRQASTPESRPQRPDPRELAVADRPALRFSDDGVGSGTGSEEPQAAINLDELASRIGGHNFALSALESSLSERARWNAAALERLVDELTELYDIHDMLAKYRVLVAEAEQERVGSLSRLDYATAAISARIAELRERLQGGASADATVEQQAELARLEELSRQVARLAVKHRN